MSSVSFREVPRDMFDKINAKEECRQIADGAKVYTITHLKGTTPEPAHRYVVYMYADGWPLACWDFGSETWYVNNDSATAEMMVPRLKGPVRMVDKFTMMNIAGRGVAGAVDLKLKEAIRGSK